MSSLDERAKALIERLEKRKVVQWTLAYLAAAWLVLQVFDIVSDQFGWPTSVGRVLTVGLGLGTAVAAVVAWYHGERGRQHVSGTELLILTGLLALGGITLTRVAGEPLAGPAPADEVSLEELEAVAVLPFQPRTRDEDDILFVDGVHDELLTRLAQLGSLHVISRTSVMAYRDRTMTIPEIARELRARYILEGGIQRAGENVRINVQLIDAAADDHLWAEVFDRPLTVENLLTIQAEIATGIARELQAIITPEEEVRLRAIPTENTEAYQQYVLGRAHFARRSSVSSIERAVGAFESAVALDPDFGLAWADLAYARLWLYWGWPGYRPQLQRAYEALERTRALIPQNPRRYTVEAAWAFYAEYDYDQALRYLERAYAADAEEGNELAGRLLRHAGRWEEALDASRRAMQVDPRQGVISGIYAQTLALMRRYDEALPAFDVYEVISGTPGGYDRFLAELGAIGDTTGMEARLERMERPRNVVRLATYLRRDYQGAFDIPRFAPFDATFWSLFRVLPALLARPGIADVYADSLRIIGEDKIRVAGEGWGPHDDLLEAIGLMALSHHFALSGQRDQAISYGRAAVDLFGIERDGIAGPEFNLALANVYVMVGSYDNAIGELERVMLVPGRLTRAWLRYDPLYDALRDDPRFRALVRTGGM